MVVRKRRVAAWFGSFVTALLLVIASSVSVRQLRKPTIANLDPKQPSLFDEDFVGRIQTLPDEASAPLSTPHELNDTSVVALGSDLSNGSSSSSSSFSSSLALYFYEPIEVFTPSTRSKFITALARTMNLTVASIAVSFSSGDPPAGVAIEPTQESISSASNEPTASFTNAASSSSSSSSSTSSSSLGLVSSKAVTSVQMLNEPSPGTRAVVTGPDVALQKLKTQVASGSLDEIGGYLISGLSDSHTRKTFDHGLKQRIKGLSRRFTAKRAMLAVTLGTLIGLLCCFAVCCYIQRTVFASEFYLKMTDPQS